MYKCNVSARLLATVGLVFALSGAADAQQFLDPNLTALPASDIAIVENFAGDVQLRFSASSWNSGLGPLEVLAGEVVRNRQNVYQRRYRDDGSYEDRLAGSFVWHQGHNHFHFEDYALYTLQPIQGKSKRTSSKTSFCIMDTDRIDTSLPGSPRNPVYDQCGNFFQGMSVGWGDTYGSQLPGQEINLDRLNDGDYRLMIEADPKNKLVETDETDNISCVLLRISVTAQTVDVLNPNGCDSSGGGGGGGDVSVAEIVPNSGDEGTSFPVTITGTGFAEGMAVSFENGDGSSPSAGNVVVQSDTLITATVTIRKKGKPTTDTVWDLRVGSGVLQDAFTVTRP